MPGLAREDGKVPSSKTEWLRAGADVTLETALSDVSLPAERNSGVVLDHFPPEIYRIDIVIRRDVR